MIGRILGIFDTDFTLKYNQVGFFYMYLLHITMKLSFIITQ